MVGVSISIMNEAERMDFIVRRETLRSKQIVF
jgi:hypothetical protein